MNKSIFLFSISTTYLKLSLLSKILLKLNLSMKILTLIEGELKTFIYAIIYTILKLSFKKLL